MTASPKYMGTKNTKALWTNKRILKGQFPFYFHCD